MGRDVTRSSRSCKVACRAAFCRACYCCGCALSPWPCDGCTKPLMEPCAPLACRLRRGRGARHAGAAAAPLPIGGLGGSTNHAVVCLLLTGGPAQPHPNSGVPPLLHAALVWGMPLASALTCFRPAKWPDSMVADAPAQHSRAHTGMCSGAVHERVRAGSCSQLDPRHCLCPPTP